MDPTRISTQVRVKHCSLCQGDTEYYCHNCQLNMCLQCKKIHVIDLDTKDHEVTRYAEKTKIPPKQIMSARSRDSDNHEPCEIPVSDFYPEHRPWRFLPPVWLSPLDHNRHNEIERRLHSERIHHLRGETLYYRHVLLEGLRHDVKTGHKKVTMRGQFRAEERAQELKDLIDDVLAGDLYDRCLIQKTRLSKHIVRLAKYERRYEEYSCRPPVKYLRFIKHKPDPRKNEQKLINRLVNIMKGMQLSTESEKRQAGNELLLILMPFSVLQKSLTVEGVYTCYHISFVTSDRVWVSDTEGRLILTDTTTDDKLHSVDNPVHDWTGIHTLNSKRELIYIDKDYNINKLSSDMKTTTRFIEKPESPWKPRCVYCSPSTGDLLVGVSRRDTETRTVAFRGQVMRYSNTGKHTLSTPHEVDNTPHTQTIPHDTTPHKLYMYPSYITENNNGDVVVSDYYRHAVVVTERGGRHRFSYTGHPSGSELRPGGICTDALSHILFCDGNTRAVLMISKDGEFLSYLQTREPPWIRDYPWSLSYDVNTHLLWVSLALNNMVYVYRYINRHLTPTASKLEPIAEPEASADTAKEAEKSS